MSLRKVFLKWIGKLDKIEVEPFLALGNGKLVFTKGRVISAYKQSRPSRSKNWLQNILATIRRYSVTGIPDVTVKISIGPRDYFVETDEDGVFEKYFEDFDPGLEKVFFKISAEKEAKETKDKFLNIHRFSASVGIISDVDDTILISHATQVGKKFWLSISKNAYTRRPLPGVSKFYKKLTEDGKHPIFYVSSSDWSLFDLIRDFLVFRDIPMGPILLKDKHINIKNIWKSGGGSHEHKKDKIIMLLEMFPEMNFHLIGDSGQHDPEIYEEIVSAFPTRIKSVFIRIVDPSKVEQDRRERLEKIPNFHFIENTQEAMEIAEKFT